MLNQTVVLSNGYEIPSIGFGTWQTPDGETAVHAVETAIACGYTHIDTAAAYKNEASVGLGIRQSGINSESLFVTSKVWNTNRGYKKTMAAFEKTLSDLLIPDLCRKKLLPSAGQMALRWRHGVLWVRERCSATILFALSQLNIRNQWHSCVSAGACKMMSFRCQSRLRQAVLQKTVRCLILRSLRRIWQ